MIFDQFTYYNNSLPIYMLAIRLNNVLATSFCAWLPGLRFRAFIYRHHIINI